MIIERPDAPNDREVYIGNLDHEIEDKETFDKNYENCFGKFIPQYERNRQNVDTD